MSTMSTSPSAPLYAPEITTPMEKELTDLGFESLRTAEEVSSALAREGTAFVVINSVCGCAAGAARPAITRALEQSKKKPRHLFTAFAGVDRSAVDEIRLSMRPFPASSPSMGLFKKGELIQFIGRQQIEGRSAEDIAEHIQTAFEECG